MGVAPAKVIFMVILSFEAAPMSSLIFIIFNKKGNKQIQRKIVILQSIGIIIYSSTVVLYNGIIKVWGFLPKIPPTNQPNVYFVMA